MLLALGISSPKVMEAAFRDSCRSNDVDTAKSILSIGTFNKRFSMRTEFLSACADGNLPVAKWLGSLLRFAWTRDALELASYRHNYEIAQWLIQTAPRAELIHGFVWICDRGWLDLARAMVEWGDPGLNIHADQDLAFVRAIANGHVETAKWLYTLGGVNGHVDGDFAFRRMCSLGLLEGAQWLWSSLGDIDIHADEDDAFISACTNGHLDVARWLATLDPDTDTHVDDDTPFVEACAAGHLSVAAWLHSVGGVNIHARNDAAFVLACGNGHLHLAKWLWSLGIVEYDKCRVFENARRSGCAETVRWLLSTWNYQIPPPCTDMTFLKTWTATRGSWIQACVCA